MLSVVSLEWKLVENCVKCVKQGIYLRGILRKRSDCFVATLAGWKRVIPFLMSKPLKSSLMLWRFLYTDSSLTVRWYVPRSCQQPTASPGGALGEKTAGSFG